MFPAFTKSITTFHVCLNLSGKVVQLLLATILICKKLFSTFKTIKYNENTFIVIHKDTTRTWFPDTIPENYCSEPFLRDRIGNSRRAVYHILLKSVRWFWRNREMNSLCRRRKIFIFKKYNKGFGRSILLISKSI